MKNGFTVVLILACTFALSGTYNGLPNTNNYLFFSFAGLFFPFTLLSLIIILFVALFKKSKLAILPIITLMLCLKQAHALLALNLPEKFELIKNENTLRVLSWNVSRWDERNKAKRGGEGYRPLMLGYIESTGADVLCLQEFFECSDPSFFAANIPALKQKGYPYSFFAPSSVLFDGKFKYGLCIFSKLPITGTAFFPNFPSEHSEGLMYADISFNNQTIRVFNSHLQSPGFSTNDFKNGHITLSKHVFTKVAASYRQRNMQAKEINRLLKQNEQFSVLCADLGDVPNSSAYFTLSSGMKDAFLKKGFGLGRTIKHTSPTLRVDYIFINNKLRIQQFKTDYLPYSDHFPLIADIQF